MRVLFAAGGSAGHVDPAIATARSLVNIDPTAKVSFMGTVEGIETRLVIAAGFPLHTIRKLPLPRSFSLHVFAWPIHALLTFLAARKIVRESDIIVGFGSYVSGFAVLAGFTCGKPILVHEANAIPGVANRMAVKLGAIAVASYPRASQILNNCRTLGLPMSEELTRTAALAVDSRELNQRRAKQHWGFSAERPMVLVLGGSLGASRLNGAIEELVASGTFANASLLHSVGSGSLLPQIAGTDEGRYLPVNYIDDMAHAFAGADLVISRAGAGACAQITLFEVPAIFVPLWHGNGEQGANAAPLVEIGAAISLIDDSSLSKNLETFVAQLLNGSSELDLMRSRYQDLPPSLRSTSSADEFAQMIVESRS